MAAYLVQRLISLGLTLLVATVVIFVVLNVLPGDPASYMMGLNANPETLAHLRDIAARIERIFEPKDEATRAPTVRTVQPEP